MSASTALVRHANEDSLASRVHTRGKDYVLYRGDCLDVLSKFDDATFDLVFADPPYFLSNGGFTCSGGKRVAVKKGGWDESQGIAHDHEFTTAWLQAVQRVLKPTGSLWVSGTQHVIFNVGFAMQKLGFKLLNTVTWFKPNASPNLSCRYFTHSSEIIVWASPGGKGKLKHTFNYQAMKAANGGKQMRDMWTMLTPRNAEKEHGRHPTQKPLALLNRIVEASSNEDQVVLDPFCGSGTTGVASVGKGRRFVGIEMDPNYLELSRRRIEAAERP